MVVAVRYTTTVRVVYNNNNNTQDFDDYKVCYFTGTIPGRYMPARMDLNILLSIIMVL